MNSTIRDTLGIPETEAAPPEPQGTYLFELSKIRQHTPGASEVRNAEITALFTIYCTDSDAENLRVRLNTEAVRCLGANNYGIVVTARIIQHYLSVWDFEAGLKEIEEEAIRKAAREGVAATFWKNQR